MLIHLYETRVRRSEEPKEFRGKGYRLRIRDFDGDYIEQQDRRYEYGERRFIAIGRIGESVFVVVYACRAGRRRIISARRANRRERDVYNKAINKGTRGLAASRRHHR
ncbi:MAG: BrnT family toxin [Rhodoplanes sp.]